MHATRRKWSSASAGRRAATFLKVAETLCQRLGPRPDRRDLLRGRLDPAHHGRPDNPRGHDPAVAAGQYRPARRRHPRPARPRLDPGLDRYPHALQPAARLSERPQCSQEPRHPGRLHRDRDQPDQLLGITFPSSSSACSRPGTAPRPPGRTTTASAGCPATSATIRTCRCSSPCPKARSTGSWRWARTRPSAARTPSFQRRALAKLDWLVVRDLYETETATFWKDSPEVKSGETKPEDIATEVFLLPAAATAEMDGTYTNTQRLIQWHDRAADPPGDARSDLWFTVHLGLRAEAALRRQHARARPAHPGPDLGLHRPPKRTPNGGSRTSPPRRSCSRR